METKVKWEGNWEGRESTEWIGIMAELQKKIPMFTIDEFRIGNGINKYKDLIVREPLSLLSDRMSHSKDMRHERIPIEAVSNTYKRSRYRGKKQGYKLYQHRTLIEVLIKILPEIKSVVATLRLSIYGARMYVEFLVPSHKRDDYILKITSINSVDRSMALTINVFLHHVRTASDILFHSFHHVHTQELEDSDVQVFLSHAKKDFLKGTWDTDKVNKDDIGVIIDDNITGDDADVIIDWLDGEGEYVNLQRFRELLARLYAAGESVFPSQKFVKFTKLIREINLLVDASK